MLLLHGERRLLVIYFVGSTFDILTSSALGANAYMIGASGGGFALLGVDYADVVVVDNVQRKYKDSTFRAGRSSLVLKAIVSRLFRRQFDVSSSPVIPQVDLVSSSLWDR